MCLGVESKSHMNIKYPVSAVLTVIIGALFLGLSVLWSFGHMIAVMVAIGLLFALRGVCHWEVRHPDFTIRKLVA